MEAMMKDYDYQSDFAKKYVAQEYLFDGPRT